MTTLSPDGKWLWTGEQWIPAPPSDAPPAGAPMPPDDDWAYLSPAEFRRRTGTDTPSRRRSPLEWWADLPSWVKWAVAAAVLVFLIGSLQAMQELQDSAEDARRARDLLSTVS